MPRMVDQLVSIVIPVYNVEKYLDACMRSVVGQTYSALEIILVDDKSPDGSGKICDAWARKDKRVKVVHKSQNEGLNMARLTGFQNSTGEYVTFLDSDDLFHKDNIRLCLEELRTNNAEAAVYAYAEFSDAAEKEVNRKAAAKAAYEVRVLGEKTDVVKYALLGDAGFPDTHFMTAWGKLYSRRLVELVDWHKANFRSYEDNFWTPQALVGAKKVVLLSGALCFYRRNERYGVAGKTLGNRLVGNSRNGEPVGYLELIDLLYKFYEKLAKKHGIDVMARLQDLRYERMMWCLENLIEAGMLGEENNLKYLKGLWAEHRSRDAEQDGRVQYYYTENERLNAELDGFLGIKRSAKLLAGNIKRRLARQGRVRQQG